MRVTAIIRRMSFGLLLVGALAHTCGSVYIDQAAAAPESNSCNPISTPGCSTSSAAQAVSPEQQLAEKYAPIAMLKRQKEPCDRYGEPYLPAPVEVVFDDPEVKLVQVTGRSRSSVELIKYGPSIADLAGEDDTFHLDFPGNPRRPRCDYERWFRQRMVGHVPVTYANVVSADNRVAVQYWFWYVFNDFNNTHEGDWEMVQVVFDADSAADALTKSPTEVGFSQHAGGERSDWNDKKLTKEGDHPVVFVAAGSHASNYGSATYLAWGENNTGFGCDVTTGPSDRVPLKVVTLPHDISQATGELAWLKWPGRWGERQPVFYNGPEGPGVRERWRDPFSWQDGLRNSSLEIPESFTFGPGPTSVFCTTVEYSSFLLTRLAVYPWLVIGLLIALAVAFALLVRFGWPMFLDAWRVYTNHLRLFVLLGVVLIPIGLVANAIQFVFIDYPPGRQVFQTLNSSPGARLAIALTIGGLQELISLIIVGPAVIAAVRELTAGRQATFAGSYRIVFDRFRVLVRSVARSFAAIIVLGISVVGIPWAIERAVRWLFVSQAAIIDETSPREAMDRSANVVVGRWWRTAASAVFFWFVSIAPGPVVGIALLVIVTPAIRYVNWISSLIYAVMLPVSVIGVTLLYQKFKRQSLEQSPDLSPGPLATPSGDGTSPAPIA